MRLRLRLKHWATDTETLKHWDIDTETLRLRYWDWDNEKHWDWDIGIKRLRHWDWDTDTETLGVSHRGWDNETELLRLSHWDWYTNVEIWRHWDLTPEFCETTYFVQDQDQDLSWYHFYFKTNTKSWNETFFETNTKRCLDFSFLSRPIPRLDLIL